MNDYILEVGKKGFDRLKFLNGVFGEHSRNFLLRAGLEKGMTVVDVGCGAGSMTIWLSRIVGPRGWVLAIDASEQQIAIAREAAEESGAKNVEFVCSTIESLKREEPTADLIYARLVLMHVKDPVRVLIVLKDFLKPGGVIACEEPHSTSLGTSPYNESIERLNRMFVDLGTRQGLDFNIGDRLLPTLAAAGYSTLHGCFVQPVISMPEAMEFVFMGATEIAPVAIASGMVTEEEAKRILANLKHQEAGRNAYYIFPRQAQVFGYKSLPGFTKVPC